jgi:DNA invertase Pin-like site-specific DNA recombinase
LRVSRKDQSVDRQLDGLSSLCDEIRIEKISACADTRPVFDDLIKTLKPSDTLVVWDVDRAFRSGLDALTCSQNLAKRGVGFRIATMNLDPCSRYGNLIYGIMALIAEHERDHLIERTREGLAAARARGQRLGRPPKMNEAQLHSAKKLLDAGKANLEELARKHKMHPSSVSRAIRRISETGQR